MASDAFSPVSILSPRSLRRCIVPAHFLQFNAFQHCKPLRGAHCKLVVPIAGQWCLFQTCGPHCKPMVPIANLWSQFGAHCPGAVCLTCLEAQTQSLMRYIWTCTSTYRGALVDTKANQLSRIGTQDLPFVNAQLNLKELRDNN